MWGAASFMGGLPRPSKMRTAIIHSPPVPPAQEETHYPSGRPTDSVRELRSPSCGWPEGSLICFQHPVILPIPLNQVLSLPSCFFLLSANLSLPHIRIFQVLRPLLFFDHHSPLLLPVSDYRIPKIPLPTPEQQFQAHITPTHKHGTLHPF